jgi:predicted porin
LLFGRQAYVGLREKGVGTLTLGRQYTPIYNTLTTIDPNRNNWGGSAGQLMSGEKAGTRQNNTVKFTSENLGGVTTEIAYGFGEVPGDSAKGRQYGGALQYAKGSLTLRTAYNSTTNAAGTDRARNTLSLAKYDFGFVTAGVGYGTNKGTGTTDSHDMIVGLTFPFGKHSLQTSYIRKDDRSAANKFDAHEYQAVYIYNLSKRTILYAAYAKLSNTNFTTTKFGSGDRETDLGMRITF